MSDFKGLFKIRSGKESDKNFILATFLRGLYYGDSWFSEIPKDVFMDNYKHVAQALVNHPDTVVKIACLLDDEDVIIGYSLLNKDSTVCHWVYVKAAWRKNGIARTLCSNHPTSVSHLTGLGKELMKKFDGCVFNPFRLF